ncbi:MAG: hypothetical protein U0640_10405 [Phycisphaerales bacterium]
MPKPRDKARMTSGDALRSPLSIKLSNVMLMPAFFATSDDVRPFAFLNTRMECPLIAAPEKIDFVSHGLPLPRTFYLSNELINLPINQVADNLYLIRSNRRIIRIGRLSKSCELNRAPDICQYVPRIPQGLCVSEPRLDFQDEFSNVLKVHFCRLEFISWTHVPWTTFLCRQFSHIDSLSTASPSSSWHAP